MKAAAMTSSKDDVSPTPLTGRIFYRYAYEVLPEMVDSATASPVVRAEHADGDQPLPGEK